MTRALILSDPHMARGLGQMVKERAEGWLEIDPFYAQYNLTDIPLGDTLDFELVRTGLPVVLVGEPGGGCTGSEELWSAEMRGELTIHRAASMFPGFRDVPRWSGIHDQTWVVGPRMLLEAAVRRW